MLRCAVRGSAKSRLFEGRSDSLAAVLLKLLPIDESGADATFGLGRRAVFVADGRLLVVEGLLQSGCGPVESRSPMEKERLGAEPASNVVFCGSRGEEATLGGMRSLVTAMSSSSALMPSSTSTEAGFTSSRDDTKTGVYFLSGYTRLITFGIAVELRLLATETSFAAAAATTLGVK